MATTVYALQYQPVTGNTCAGLDYTENNLSFSRDQLAKGMCSAHGSDQERCFEGVGLQLSGAFSPSIISENPLLIGQQCLAYARCPALSFSALKVPKKCPICRPMDPFDVGV